MVKTGASWWGDRLPAPIRSGGRSPDAADLPLQQHAGLRQHVGAHGLAQALDAAGDPATAAAHYRLCAAARADWMMPRILLGKALLRTGVPADRATARPVLEEALALAIAQDHQDPAAELSALLASLT